ncbi:MAG: hypothetical protein WCA07_04850, partial [Gloeobacterales cyanobacterium]
MNLKDFADDTHPCSFSRQFGLLLLPSLILEKSGRLDPLANFRSPFSMRIHAICLVKNEGDVIAQTLRHASQFCHKIYVFDTG